MNIAVLISGGVDSSVALRLLQEQGHTLTAFYLKIWLEDELSFMGTCPWEEDLAYVEAVCKQAGVPLQVISLQKEYWDEVVSYTIAEIRAGRTPNPDIMCNQRVKFGAFYKKIAHLGFDKIATGHYAQVRQESDGRFTLFRSPDPIKDQTYFLSHMNQDQLSRALFPIGHLYKSQVREYAERFDLPNKVRKDSQGICFLGKLKFTEFVKYHLGEQEGDLIEFETGALMGKHKGFWFYTVGQRQGIGLSGGPWYVVAKDTVHNKIFISRTYYAPDKKRDTLTVEPMHWLSGQAPVDLESRLFDVKLRHGERMDKTSVEVLDSGALQLTLSETDQGIAPGQFAVLYDGDICLGSGVIAK